MSPAKRSVKRVLLGSAAGIFTVAGAQAADLPTKAQPVEYVKACSIYGAGFWYVPGTDTCIKIGSFAKLQVEYNMNGGGPFMLGATAGANGAVDLGGLNTRTDTAPFTIAGRFAGISADLRTQTEYGTLRSYMDVIIGNGSNAAWQSGLGQQSGQTVTNTRAFIQFAGFTAGRMRSFFDLYFQGVYTYSGQKFGNDTSPNGVNGIAYTWQFGNGFSTSVSLEDNSGTAAARGRLIVNTNPAFTGEAAQLSQVLSIGNPELGDDAGVQFFDPVFNLRLDQEWGFWGLSGAIHNASGGYYGNTEATGHPPDAYGWAVTTGGVWNNPFGLNGDSLAAEGVWSKGASGFATPSLGPVAAFAGSKLGFGFLMDGIYNGTTLTNVDLVTVWSANAAYEHLWNPQWRTSIYTGILGTQFDQAAASALCQQLVHVTNITATQAANSCAPNWSMWEAGTRTQWNPVPDLDIGFDVVYYRLNTAFNGQTVNYTGNINFPFISAKAPGLYNASDINALGAVFRIQRNFLY
jgi:Porin subfamily